MRKFEFSCLCLAGVVLLWALPMTAQISRGGLHLTMDGQITAGYNGDFGNQESSDHSIDVSGDGSVRGYYYLPQFISFNVLPYYGRSQDNSTSQSISDSSGYTGIVNMFNGTHFPAFVSFNQQWNGTGTFGIPGITGLITKENSHQVTLGWNIKLPDLPTLTLGFSNGSGSSSVLGSDSTSTFTNRVFSVGSSYRLFGAYLNGGYSHQNTDSSVGGLLAGGDSTSSSSNSANLYYLNATRKLPFLASSNISAGFNRTSYTDTISGGQTFGTTDNALVNLSLPFHRLPVTVTGASNATVIGITAPAP